MFIGGVSYYKPYDLDSTNTHPRVSAAKFFSWLPLKEYQPYCSSIQLLELFDKDIVVVETQGIDRGSLGRVVYDRVQAMTRTYLF